MKHVSLSWALCGVLLFAGCGKHEVENLAAPSASATLDGKTGPMLTPQLNCGVSTRTSITVVVTAGATGADAGFSLQWMPLATYQANGGSWSEAQLCKASFSGNARDSRYRLAAGQSVAVTVGNLVLDNGASTHCPQALVCGTPYVFRIFAHANRSLNRSEFSAPFVCSTLGCTQVPGSPAPL
ncbi:hypothetical protein [Hymenobacter weizhouensis]|uniref:hypothetical protein n=1 Tax=Hymenobacter sp. YIM 151500-1 TaxID=2987689 RepID=UPI00222666C5|nr:hypothetical protein [Hymenobacter sp. YIM 151500-1]UYZ63920.1 hypothetical protein OIS53_03535 [Hymenobacter sp. YIM 151500-1]